ncbi:MAG TPA: nucleoside hydrolase [Phycisphaerae bacterium]|nr:nucleoside hydrolase [Phycisphaerae bacterium]
MYSVSFAFVFLAGFAAAAPTDSAPDAGFAAGRVPVIYGTDLFHPHNDPDDHFDLATLFSVRELDVQAILLDQGQRQGDKTGRIPIEQMLRLTGRRIPFASGLSSPLTSPQDTGADQPAGDQGDIELLLQSLRAAPRPVTVIAVGSVRDLCAAFNREPDLLRRKVGRLYLNMGNSTDGSEYNVDLDIHAYVGLMRSGLPIWWCPCMPRGDAGSTFWNFHHADVLRDVPTPVVNYFIYALQAVSPQEIDPQSALSANIQPWRHLVLKMDREMWSTASILDAAGMKIYKVGNTYRPARTPPAGGQLAEVYTFVPARVDINDKGRTKAELRPSEPNMQAFRITDGRNYAQAMRDCLGWLLRDFPLAPEFRSGHSAKE